MMVTTREQLIKDRIEIAKAMNKYIINLGDEEIWESWITLGIPDCPSEEDYEFIASDDDEWTDLCKLFGILVKTDKD